MIELSSSLHLYILNSPEYLLLARSAVPIEKDPESGDGDILRLEDAFFGDILRLPRRLDTLLSSALVCVVAISSSSMVCSLFRQSSALLVILVGAQSLLGVILRGPALPREERAAPPRRTWIKVKSQIKSKSSEAPTADNDVCVFPILDLYFWADSRRSEVQNCPVEAVP